VRTEGAEMSIENERKARDENETDNREGTMKADINPVTDT
jgi:hypothetical protein